MRMRRRRGIGGTLATMMMQRRAQRVRRVRWLQIEAPAEREW
jgi:hypothetical protein